MPDMMIYSWSDCADFFPLLARNRVLVVMDWLKSYVFGRDVSRE
jgi:hypothetical protein